MSQQPFQVGDIVERVIASPSGRQNIGDRKVIQEIRGLPMNDGGRKWLLHFDDDFGSSLYSRAGDFRIVEPATPLEPEAAAHG